MSMSIAEAKSRFSSVVERASAGEEIVITKHGRPVAKVVAVRSDRDKAKAREAFEEMVKLRDESGASLGGLDWKALRDEGRK